MALLLASLVAGCAGSPQAATASPEGATASPTGAPVGVRASAATPQPAAPTPAAQPWIVHAGHADNGIVGIFLIHPDGFDGTWILSEVQGAGLNRPDWSPDGRRLVFERFTDANWSVGTIWSAAADGSDTRQLAACKRSPCVTLSMPAWSPDGTEVAAIRCDLAADGVSAGPSAIEVVNVASGESRIVSTTPDGRTSFAAPRWAPDGQSMVVEVDRYASAKQDRMTGSAIATVAIAGVTRANPTVITEFAAMASHPDWSADGRRIVFTTYDIDAFAKGGPGPSNLFIVRPDGTGLTQVTQFPLGGPRAGQASWTPDGKRIIFTKVDGSDYGGFGARHTTFIDADGSNIVEISASRLGTFPRLQPPAR